MLSCKERFSAWEEEAPWGDNCSCLTTGNPPEKNEDKGQMWKRIELVYLRPLATHPSFAGPSRREPGIPALGFSHAQSYEMHCAIVPEYPATQNNTTPIILHIGVHFPAWYGRDVFTCVMEPPGLAEEMRGGGSGIWRGRTAAILSCGWRLGAKAERKRLFFANFTVWLVIWMSRWSGECRLTGVVV